MTTKFENPIIPGFAPDPSVVYVDGTFFLVNSSFHLFPGLPIYASQDLSNWKHIGNAINRASQISLQQAITSQNILDTGATLVATGGLFAPTIRFHDGSFYIICTNASAGGGLTLQNFYITTKDIWSNQWSDPINFDWNGIDPSLYFDDDNRAYIQGCWVLSRTQQPTCTIKQMEIDIKTGKPLSKPTEIWQGFTKYDSEGPHIYKKDGYYYLLIAEGGTFEHHMLSIARSLSIWGPFESYENNPILTADGTDEYIQHTGHGELFEDGNGQWWAAVLGVRRRDLTHYPMGRETFLTPVSWPTGGWPEIQQPKIRFSHKTLVSKPREIKCIAQQQERVSDVFIRDFERASYSLSPNGLQITMKPSVSTITSVSGKVSFLGKRQRDLDCFATVTVLVDENNAGKRLDAGLAVYKDSFRHAEIFYDHNTSEICFNLHNQLNKDSSSRRKVAGRVITIDLRISATELMYEFQYRTSKEDGWSKLGSVDTCEITARDFTGPLFGIFAFGDDGEKAAPVTFPVFEITPDTRF